MPVFSFVRKKLGLRLVREDMRKISEPEAHRARVALLEGRYPEGMQIRCAWCRQVRAVAEGEFVLAKVVGSGHTHFFKCSECQEKAA